MIESSLNARIQIAGEAFRALLNEINTQSGVFDDYHREYFKIKEHFDYISNKVIHQEPLKTLKNGA